MLLDTLKMDSNTLWGQFDNLQKLICYSSQNLTRTFILEGAIMKKKFKIKF
jgi:hypothetical protein